MQKYTVKELTQIEGERHMAVNPLEHHANEIMDRVSKLWTALAS